VFEAILDNGWETVRVEQRLRMGASTGSEIVVEANRDAFVRGGSFAATNYGTNAHLAVKHVSGNPFYQRESYFAFAAPPGVTEITSARVELTIDDPGESPVLEVFQAATNWTESGLTWNTRPAAGVSLLAFLPSNATQVIDLDPSLFAAGGGEVAIGVRTTETTAALTYFSSREAPDPDARPRLILTGAAQGLYEQWAREVFGEATVDDAGQEATVWGELADPDQDGIRNLFAAWGGIQSSDTPQISLDLQGGGTWLFTVDLPELALPVLPEVSLDLRSWDEVAVEDLTVVEVSADSALLGLAAPNAPRAFLRFRSRD
jgi:hypothetical protein